MGDNGLKLDAATSQRRRVVLKAYLAAQSTTELAEMYEEAAPKLDLINEIREDAKKGIDFGVVRRHATLTDRPPGKYSALHLFQ